ncbi:MAG: rhombosortase [Pseudomonadota bacterium]
MAGGVRGLIIAPRTASPHRRPGAGGRRAWAGVSLLLLVPAMLIEPAQAMARMALAWDATRVAAEPWRCWSAAWVHLSALHLGANLAGGVLVLLLGWLARPPRDAAWAWALAWPLTHLGLLALPQVVRYAGMSGVLHAGVAVMAVTLVGCGRDRVERVVGALVLVGLAAKLAAEPSWSLGAVRPDGWDIAVVPAAHAIGAGWGVLLALALVVLPRLRSRPWSPARPPGSWAG